MVLTKKNNNLPILLDTFFLFVSELKSIIITGSFNVNKYLQQDLLFAIGFRFIQNIFYEGILKMTMVLFCLSQ